MSKQPGLTFVNSLSEALWYVDGNSKTLEDRSLSVPPMFQHLQGYRKPEKHKFGGWRAVLAFISSCYTSCYLIYEESAVVFSERSNYKSFRKP